MGRHRFTIRSVSCSTSACAHPQAPLRCYGLDLGIPLVLRLSAPSWEPTMGRRGGLSAADSARPPGAGQSPSVPSVPLISMAEVSPSPNNALGGGSEWTRPNEGGFLLTSLGPEGQTRKNTLVLKLRGIMRLYIARASFPMPWLQRCLTGSSRAWSAPTVDADGSFRFRPPNRQNFRPARRRGGGSTGLDRGL